jgi:hypothetical protein
MAHIDQKVNIEFVEDVETSTEDGKRVGGKDGGLLVDASGDILRLPVPSADPNDPLNFTKWEKMGVIVSCCWFCEFSFHSASMMPFFLCIC